MSRNEGKKLPEHDSRSFFWVAALQKRTHDRHRPRHFSFFLLMLSTSGTTGLGLVSPGGMDSLVTLLESVLSGVFTGAPVQAAEPLWGRIWSGALLPCFFLVFLFPTACFCLLVVPVLDVCMLSCAAFGLVLMQRVWCTHAVRGAVLCRSWRRCARAWVSLAVVNGNHVVAS